MNGLVEMSSVKPQSFRQMSKVKIIANAVGGRYGRQEPAKTYPGCPGPNLGVAMWEP